MSILPAIRVVFAVALLSAAPVAARERGDSSAMPLVWAPAGAAIAVSPLEAQDEGPGGHAPVVAASTCNAEINGDNITDFASVDAQAVRDALAAVAANGTVKIAGYCAGAMPQGGTTQTALITKTITLAGGYTTTDWTTYNPAGNPTTLDALLGGRVISATAAATLRGFRVTGGYISSTIEAYGGGINAAGALTLSGTQFLSNTAGLRGGGAYAQGAATLNGGLFQNNSVGNSAGDLGGGLYAATTLALSGTQFLGNTAPSGGGGAYAQGAATLNGGVFQSNTATYYAAASGGGLMVLSTLALSGTQFLGNTAISRGGGAYASGATTLTGGVFQNNAASNGGGLRAQSTLALSGTQFLSNTAGIQGGGAYAFGATTLTGGVFQSNSAGDSGGGLYANATLALSGTQFLSNTANYYAAASGGGAYAQGAATLNGGLFQNNSAGDGDEGGGGRRRPDCVFDTCADRHAVSWQYRCQGRRALPDRGERQAGRERAVCRQRRHGRPHGRRRGHLCVRRSALQSDSRDHRQPDSADRRDAGDLCRGGDGLPHQHPDRDAHDRDRPSGRRGG